MPDILILRPEPGAIETQRRAATLGLSATVTPLFRIEPVHWRAPAAWQHDAIVFTSANAPRQAGPQVEAYLHLPAFAVGEESARAAGEAGFADVRTGPADANALAAMLAEEGVERPLHLCGRDHVPLDHPGAERRIVYAAEPVEALPDEAVEALGEGAVALLHSARAGALFAKLVGQAGLVPSALRLAAISKATALAAGPGWEEVGIAAAPRDHALLERAFELCHKARPHQRMDI